LAHVVSGPKAGPNHSVPKAPMMDSARQALQRGGEACTLAGAAKENKPWDGDGVPLKDSNCARIGSDEDKDARKKAAMTENAWKGAGTQAGLKVWRIENFQVVPWPEDRYGEFMMADSYIVLSTTEEPDSGKLLHDIHFWLGRDTTPDEMGTAAYKTVELDDYFDGEPIQHREVQNSESHEFRSFFPRFSYKKGGKASGFRKASSTIELYEHKMYRVRKMQVDGLRLEEVALHHNSLNDGDVFILDAGAKIYIWEGPQASPFEKFHANKEAGRMVSERDGKATAMRGIDDEFWDHVGGRGPIKAAEEVTDVAATVKALTTRLYQIRDADGELSCHEVGHGQLSESMLQSNDVMMLVTADELFLWVGKGSSTAEGRSCYRLAMDYLKVNKRPMSTPIHLFKEGQTMRNERWLAAFANIPETEAKPIGTLKLSCGTTGKVLCVYPGFTEHAYRLVFPFKDHFAPDIPQLLTIMPSGVVETNTMLEPQKEEALIAFTFPQSMSDQLAEPPVLFKPGVNVDDNAPVDSSGRILRDTPFVWRREDGTNALVQTWPTTVNEKFRKSFEISEGTNPDSNKFQPQAVAEFQEAMARLFGPAAANRPILFCHKKTENTSPAVVGTSEEVLAHLTENPGLMRKLAILSVDREGLSFVSDGTDGDGNKFEKHFTMTEGEQCVVYRKIGWDTMGCTKPLQQFLRDAELHQPSTLEATPEPWEKATVCDFTKECASVAEAFYSYADLSDPNIWRCKPDIIDRPHEREQFLAPDVFEEIFGMTKEDFSKLRRWKQICLKKDHRLF